MDIFMQGTQTLRPGCILEIEDYLAVGWSWGIMAKLLSRKWGVSLTAKELQTYYQRTRQAQDAAETENRRRNIGYYAAALE